jgi:hypothetical protein
MIEQKEIANNINTEYYALSKKRIGSILAEQFIYNVDFRRTKLVEVPLRYNTTLFYINTFPVRGWCMVLGEVGYIVFYNFLGQETIRYMSVLADITVRK